MTVSEQRCPICNVTVEPNLRYPLYVCTACACKVVSSDKRPLRFGNVSISGGLSAQYGDTGEEYPGVKCFIDGIACKAEEARFGGVVIQALDFRKFADLEGYLFSEVHQRFATDGSITPFDFYCILVWKANRAKSKTKKRLVALAKDNFGAAVARISAGLRKANSPQARLRLLMEEWDFLLPTASAVLTVLYPEEFTVYDVRVCDSIDGFHRLGSQLYSVDLWNQFLSFKEAVARKTPKTLSLRDKDRYLWGKSVHEQIAIECV